MPSSNREACELLLAGADYLEEHGHTKSTICDLEGRVCAVGALIYAAKDRDNHKLRKQALGLVEIELGRPPLGGGFVVCWNNQPERTGQEVIDKFREVAAKGLVPDHAPETDLVTA